MKMVNKNMSSVSINFLTVKGFGGIFLSLWIDGVRKDSDLTNLHMWVDI